MKFPNTFPFQPNKQISEQTEIKQNKQTKKIPQGVASHVK